MGRIAGRTGEATRAEAQRVALELFISKGYEATSMREIAERLGISKPSLYYHFAGKEDILAAGLGRRGDEAAELLHWLHDQPATPDLLERTVLRWVDSLSVEKLRGIRFVNANPQLMRRLGERGKSRIGDALSEVASTLAGGDRRRLMLIRMALLSINAAASAAGESDLSDDEIVAGARETAIGILARIAVDAE